MNNVKVTAPSTMVSPMATMSSVRESPASAGLAAIRRGSGSACDHRVGLGEELAGLRLVDRDVHGERRPGASGGRVTALSSTLNVTVR